MADGLRAGLAETSGNRTIARVTAVERRNASVVVTGDDGRIYEREHPIDEEVTLTVELAVRRTDAGVRFKGAPLQQGDTVVLDLGSATIEGVLIGSTG
jgi:hypothetical protein